MTYRQVYQDFLETILSSGGTPDQMKTTVEEYNAVGNPDYVPTQDFGVFLLAAHFDCSTCRKNFKLPDTSADSAEMKVLLDQETVCEDCGPTS